MSRESKTPVANPTVLFVSSVVKSYRCDRAQIASQLKEHTHHRARREHRDFHWTFSAETQSTQAKTSMLSVSSVVNLCAGAR
ncbi:hypothetical protein HNQ77_004265 [Silvibacterium bohemicum]|uniref:Uncharacterized protein n=1 Tax=Silvibacterium bohemicum TaxID=1577686 RepID=A0A841JXY3_9BACT|nr:hypothetical protein [Silvibacterium bohemicum]